MLKSLFNLIFILSICSSSLFAEAGGRGKKVNLWLFGGFSFTNHKASGLDGGINGNTGMSFGFGLDYRLNEQFALEVDFLDIWKSYEESIVNTLTKYNLTYFEMPFLVKYMPSQWFSLKVGPYLAAFIIEANREVGGLNTPNKGDYSNDFGMTFGMWTGFSPAKSVTIGADIRYDLGMRNILNDSLPSRNVHTRTFITMLTLVFSFK